jgi:RNA polymerase sigma-70 factor (ECF subfamily)
MRGMIAAEIQAALDELSDEHRMMIVLADLEELSYKEIADIVGCPIGTVMSRLHRARKQLQSRLINQAVELGIIAAPSASEPAAVTESGEYAAVVSLAAYRKAS